MMSFFKKRFVTVGYFALVDITKVKLSESDLISGSSTWWPIDNLPKLVIDQDSIIQKALEALKGLVNQQPIGINLLLSFFTMSEIQSLYENILCKKLDRRNFQRKYCEIKILSCAL